jgi:hypothetical protein
MIRWERIKFYYRGTRQPAVAGEQILLNIYLFTDGTQFICVARQRNTSSQSERAKEQKDPRKLG